MTTIAIDFTPAIRQQAGIGRIVNGQVNALVALKSGYDIRLLVVGPVGDGERATAPLPLHATPLSERNMVRLWHRLDSPWPPVEHFTGGPLDLFHATDFVLAPSRARRKLLTIHDLAFIFYPDAAMPSLHRYLNVVVPRSVRRADHILADSQRTALDLQEQWRVPADRITVVQGAVDHARFAPVSDPQRLAEVRARYGIHDRPYILTVSRLEPRKNHVRLIEAYAKLRLESKLPHALVIVGAKGWLYDDIFRRVQELHLDEHVIFTGYAPDTDLPTLLSGADVFAYPSLYEGFGLPIVEALACGTPVLTGDNSCLPEAGGPGAIYVNALDAECIAAGLGRILNDAGLRRRLSTDGRGHAATFTWERSAQQLLAAYQHVLA